MKSTDCYECLSCGWRGESRELIELKLPMQTTKDLREKACPECRSIVVESIVPPFKKCNVCNHTWTTRQDFINDTDVIIIGYQANLKNLKSGLLYFNHKCKSTIALQADLFSDLYNGPVFQESKHGTDDCPEYCMNKGDLRPCPAKCDCAYIREIIQLLKAHGPT